MHLFSSEMKQTTTWANVNQDLCNHMAPLGRN